MSQLSVATEAGTLADALRELTGRAAAEDVARRLAAKDPTLWGPDAEPEASIRLGWLDLPETSRTLLPGCASCEGSCSPRASTTSCSPAWAARRSLRR